MKLEFNILVNSIDKVKQFSTFANKLNDAEVTILSDKYVIDGKSIMGIFSLDVMRPLICRVTCSDESQLDEFYRSLKSGNMIFQD